MTLGTPPAVTTGPVSSRSRGSSRTFWWAVPPILLLIAASIRWSSYYLASTGGRVRSPLHPWLRPSGYVGQSAGIVALLIFLLLWLYPLRKSLKRPAWTGSLARWLDVHVVLALVLPFIAAVHAGWRFEGLIGLGFGAMVVAWASGIVGRYLYLHIPRGALGLELSAEEIAGERRALLGEVAAASGLPRAQVESLLRFEPTPCEGLGVLATLGRMARDEIERRHQARALVRVSRALPTSRLDRKSLRRLVRLARRQMALTQQARMLAATRRVFRLWHLFHRPFAVAALVAVLGHVVVAVVLGTTWFW